jgi:putative hydrolase of the HAD superfamily
MVPLVSQLHAAGYRTGILSNTCTTHWDYCYARYRMLSDAFDIHALSFELGEVKPNKEIYLAAAKLAGVSPNDVFFCDDLPENVEGARAAGFDAVVFTTAAALNDALRQRGVRFNH